MAVHTIRPKTVEHIAIHGLRISPDIVGMSHTFVVEEKQVRVDLPSIPENQITGAFPSWTGSRSISYTGFEIVDGEHVPYVCSVDDVQVTVTA